MVPNILITDQTRCYDPLGTVIPCKGSGQDAEFNGGRAISRDRFQIRVDLVFDRQTGLTWCRSANPAEFPLDWKSAHDFIKEMNVSQTFGQNKWQLPSRSDLFSLISYNTTSPALPENHPFEDVFPGYYWTRTVCNRLPNQAWYIHLGGGRVYRGMKAGSYMVWPVLSPNEETRAEKKIPAWEIRGNTMLDTCTGLMWLFSDIFEQSVTWEVALDTIRTANKEALEGYADWRLPNIRELESIVDLDSHSPALSLGNDLKITEGYWSSTTSVYEPRYAWVLYTRDGSVGVGFKGNNDFSCLAVRLAGLIL